MLRLLKIGVLCCCVMFALFATRDFLNYLFPAGPRVAAEQNSIDEKKTQQDDEKERLEVERRKKEAFAKYTAEEKEGEDFAKSGKDIQAFEVISTPSALRGCRVLLKELANDPDSIHVMPPMNQAAIKGVFGFPVSACRCTYCGVRYPSAECR